MYFLSFVIFFWLYVIIIIYNLTTLCVHDILLFIRGGNRAGRAGLGRANTGPGQNRAGLKLARFFRAKILTAQPALKTGPVGPNSHFKAKKNSGWPGRAIPGRAKFGPIFSGPKI